MAGNRPEIPEAMKREVRKECGFGCAICGMPFFQYDHIEEYAVVKEHTAENLVLLCPNHHTAKSTDKLSPERVIEAKRAPFNVNKPLTSAYKVEPSKEIVTLLGSNMLTGWRPELLNEYFLVWVNGKSFFTIHSDEDWLTISVDITDSSGKVLLSVKRGELIVSTDAWDYVYEGDNIKIRSGLGQIILDLNLTDRRVEVLKGNFVDEHLDGFIVDNGSLYNRLGGKTVGTSSRNRSYGLGGWGLLNSKSAPNVQPPQKPLSFFSQY